MMSSIRCLILLSIQYSVHHATPISGCRDHWMKLSHRSTKNREVMVFNIYEVAVLEAQLFATLFCHVLMSSNVIIQFYNAWSGCCCCTIKNDSQSCALKLQSTLKHVLFLLELYANWACVIEFGITQLKMQPSLILRFDKRMLVSRISTTHTLNGINVVDLESRQ